MTSSIEEIQEYVTYLVKDVYGNVKTEQETDQTYIDDTFNVPEIKKINGERLIYRSGYGVRIVDAPSDQIVTAQPQVFVEGKNNTVASNLAKYFNENYIDILKRGNPNIWKEFNKGQLGRGVAYFRLTHNQEWLGKDETKTGLPVFIDVPDPMILYASPEEDENGVPEKMVVQYPRQLRDLIGKYPKWSNPQKDKKTGKNPTAIWTEYYDKDFTYWEADGEGVRPEGIYPNIYKRVPFVRKYSGFGRRSPDGDLASLIVSDIRYSRDLIREECVMRSNINNQYFLFAHPDLFILGEGDLPKPEDMNQAMKIGGLNVNQLANFKGKLEWHKIEPSPEMSLHHQRIIQQLNQKHPYIMAGSQVNESGRETDLKHTLGGRKYDSTVENCEVAFATALEIVKDIIKEVPKLIDGTGLKKSDLTAPVIISVRLKADDAVAQGRASQEGSRLYAQKEITLHRNLVEYKGLTEDEATQEENKLIVDEDIRTDPILREMRGIRAAQELGMEQEYRDRLEQRKAAEKGNLIPSPTGAGSQGGEPRMGNIQTEMGMNQTDVSNTQSPPRMSPAPQGE